MVVFPRGGSELCLPSEGGVPVYLHGSSLLVCVCGRVRCCGRGAQCWAAAAKPFSRKPPPPRLARRLPPPKPASLPSCSLARTSALQAPFKLGGPRLTGEAGGKVAGDAEARAERPGRRPRRQRPRAAGWPASAAAFLAAISSPSPPNRPALAPPNRPAQSSRRQPARTRRQPARTRRQPGLHARLQPKRAARAKGKLMPRCKPEVRRQQPLKLSPQL